MSFIWEEILRHTTFMNVLITLFIMLSLWYILDLVRTWNMPPGPWLKIPLLGDVTALGNTTRHLDQVKLAEKYGPVFTLKFGVWRMVFAVGVDAVKEVLVKKSADFAGRPKLPSFDHSTLGSKGVAQADYGPAWRLHRKMFMSALRDFMSDQTSMEEKILREIKILEDFIKTQDGKPFDPDHIITVSIANVICSLTLNQHFEGNEPDFLELLRTINTTVRDPELNETIVDIFPIFQYFPDKAYKVIMENTMSAFKITSKFIKEHEETYDPAIVRDFIDGLLKAKQDAIEESKDDMASLLSHDHMVVTVADMFFAGFETTSTSLRWAFLHLANHPEIQEALQAELDNVVGADRRPTLEDKPDLPLLQATIMENQRLSNIAPEAVPHMAIKDTTLCGYDIPRGTPVIVNLYSVHMNPKIFEDPENFNPYRFIDEDGKVDTTKGNYLPFSAGRRVCAGESLAKAELFLFLSNILHSYTIKRKGEQLLDAKGQLGFTLSPVPYEVIMTARKKRK